MTKTRDLADLGGGFIQAGTGAQQRTVESKLQDVVSVLDFIPESQHAAIKAGTSTYDATADIQAALDSLPSTGGTVFIPTGIYIVSSVNASVPNTSVVGEGPSSELRHKSDITGGQPLILFTELDGCQLRDLRFNGEDITDGTGKDDCFLARFTSCNDVFVDNCEFYKSVTASLKITSTALFGKAKNINITNSKSLLSGRSTSFNRNGFDCFFLINVNIDNCVVVGSGFTPNNVGLILMGCDYCNVNNVLFEDCGSEQIQTVGTETLTFLDPAVPADNIRRAKYINITNCIFTQPSGFTNTCNIAVGPNTDHNTISNCYMEDSFSAGIQVFFGCGDLVIDSNIVKSAGGAGVSIADATIDNVVISNNLISNTSSGVSLNYATAIKGPVSITGNIIGDLTAATSKLFDITGPNISDVLISNNKGFGAFDYGIDNTGGNLATDAKFIVTGNDFSLAAVDGGRNFISGSYAWNNAEPNPYVPTLRRGTFAYNLAAGTSSVKVWSTAQSAGNLEYIVVEDPTTTGGGYVQITEGVVLGLSPRQSKLRVSEVGGTAAVAGTVYAFAKP